MTIPDDHRHLLAARRAADRVLVRGVLGDARRRGRLPPDRQSHAVAAGPRRSPTTCGRASRSRSGSRSSCSRRSRRAWSRCTRARRGDTESELHFESWRRMVALNPVLDDLEPDIEGLIVNRLAEPPVYAIAPIDRCYALTGHDQAHLGGDLWRAGVGDAVSRFFDELRARGGRRVSVAAGRRSTARPPPAPEPEFAVLGARAVRYAAAPMLTLDLQVSEPSGRPVYMIALTIQLMIEPARRGYDDATRERLVELFGAPERWAVTTRSLVWSQLDVLVPAFTGSTTVSVPITLQLRPRGRGRQVPALAARWRGAAGAALQRHDLLPGRRRRPADGARAVDAVDRLPDAGVGLARDDRALLPQHGLGGPALGDAREPAAREIAARAPDASTRAWTSC